MKPILIILYGLILSFTAYSQYDQTERYIQNINNSKNLEDSLIYFHTYKWTNDIDTIKYFNSIDRTLKDNHPLWASLEKAITSKDVDEINEKLRLIMKKKSSSSLKKYILAAYPGILRRSGIEWTIKENATPIVSKNVSSKAFESYIQWAKYYDVDHQDSMIVYMKSCSKEISKDKFPALQLYIITCTLNQLFGKITEETSPYIDQGFQLSESLNEVKLRKYLFSVAQTHYKNNGEFTKALEKAIEALNISKKTGIKKNIYHSTLDLSTLYLEQYRYDEFYKLLYDARDIANSINDSSMISYTYEKEGVAKMMDKNYIDALPLLKIGLKSSQSDPRYMAPKLATIISCYYYLNKLDSVNYYFNKMIEIDPENKSGFINTAKSYVAPYLIEKGNMKLAESYLEEAMTDAILYEDLYSKSIILLSQSKLFESQGKIEKSYSAFKAYAELEADFTTEDKIEEITKANLRNEYENEKKMTLLTTEKEKSQLEYERNQAITFGGGASFLALSCIGLFFFIRDKNRKIKNQNIKLENLNNVKDTLFQIIGHDLKKPSINFRNVSKNINYLLDKKDYSRLQALGEEVDQDAKSLYNLTDNLLNWALMQKDTVRIQPQKVNLHEIINYNLDLFQSLAKRKNITLINNVDQNVIAYVDRNSVDTIVRNLLDNAIKYTPDSGSISIFSESTDGMVQIKVKDNGVGMSKSMMDEIEASQTVQSSKGTDGEKGSGIGLQLVKQLINKNKGTLRIKSKQGEGTVISIQLPVAS